MKFSIGYQLPDLYCFSDIVAEYSSRVSEVYFSWTGIPSGRGVSIADAEEQAVLTEELKSISAHGVKLNLLWNANCYGGKAISVEFEQIIRKSINDLSKDIELNAVTATSLFVAEVIKTLFPEIEVRASVNMGIGTIAGMSYVSNYFDSFYVKRELNRHPGKIRELRRWCRDHGKKLYLLVNSGCLRECSAHTFHDNLVAHEHELHLRENRWRGFNGVCWPYYSNPKNHYSFLRDSTWIRPEEICRYSGLVDGVKLATRSHRDPAMVIESYITGNFDGNTLALCEPDFSSLCFLDNKRFPEEWPFVLENMNETEQEEYCEELLNNVKV